ncbi:MAG: signal recognition particle-docking protein FtsY [Desulfobacterales bacterium GWB2_56_26]|nr:MAG: signal recognition particle-docking protein FtsY [Desulfobacterales bacterium GWB2_56_26]
MLGWFKKKFRKQEDTAAEKEAVIGELRTDTPFSEHEQPEKEAEAAEEQRPTPAEEAPPAESTEAVLPGDVLPEITEAERELTEPEQTEQIEQIEQVEEVPSADEKADIPIPAASDHLKIVNESEVQAAKEKNKKSLFARLTERLSKTRESFTYQIDALFLGKRVIDAELLDDLEEILITADLGVETTMDLIEYARRKVKRNELSDPDSLKKALKKKIKAFMTDNETDATLVMPDTGPFVIMVIGVNGVGKTTTIGKIAHKFQQTGNSVMLVAGDTFRAAAVAQLKVWGERNKVEVVAHKEGADPSSVVFDALGIALAKKIDVVLVDTAGRLHTNSNLMEELKKIRRVMAKKLPGAPHEVMLVIDATTGQNGISQAKLFHEAVGVTGITLTKLDGTSKGGIVANICKVMKIPIRFIGIGEQLDDLRDFEAEEFVDALFHSRASGEN